MSYLNVTQIQFAAVVSLVIRHRLNRQRESIDSRIVYEKQKKSPTREDLSSK